MGDPPLNGVLLTDTYCHFWYIFTWTACLAVSWKSLSCLPLSSHQQWSFSVQMDPSDLYHHSHPGDETGRGIWPHREVLVFALGAASVCWRAEYWSGWVLFPGKPHCGLDSSASGFLLCPFCHLTVLPAASVLTCPPAIPFAFTCWSDWLSCLRSPLKSESVMDYPPSPAMSVHLSLDSHLSSSLPVPVSLPVVRLLRQQGIHT